MAVDTASSDSYTQRNVTSHPLAMTAGNGHIPETTLDPGPAAGIHPVPGTEPCCKLQLEPSAERKGVTHNTQSPDVHAH